MSEYPPASTEAAALSLLLDELPRVAVKKLCKVHGSPMDVLASNGSPLKVWQRGSQGAARAVTRRRDRCQRDRVGLLCQQDEGFPRLLRCIPDAPLLLYYRGDLDALNQPGVALVGARRASRWSLDLARSLSRSLAERGATVVSGLALGVDTAAHQGALDAQGRTVAVLGSGLNRVQPRSNLPLARALLASGGLIVSEYPMQMPAAPFRFPERNRLISGLADGVVVVEASARSGSLITARLAGEQGREVMAVPGAPGLPNSAGANRLLKTGAALIESADDVLEALGFLLPDAIFDGSGKAGSGFGLTEELSAVLDRLDGRAVSAQSLALVLDLDIQECAIRLTELELGGFVQRVTDGYIRRPSAF